MTIVIGRPQPAVERRANDTWRTEKGECARNGSSGRHRLRALTS